MTADEESRIGPLNSWRRSLAIQAGTKVPTPSLPDHIEETIRSIAQLRAEHHETATALERALDHVTALLTRIMRELGRFCSSDWRPCADDPSGWIGVRLLAVQRVWG